MRIACLQHADDVVPANVLAWAHARAHDMRVYEVNRGELPDDWAFDLAVVLGGPMAAWEEDEHPWLRAEKAWLRELLDRRMPVVGICLGSQLLAELLGATVRRAQHQEIGWWAVERLAAAAGSPVFAALPDVFDAFCWHSDTWELPEGATRMARSEACANQAFEYGGFVYAVQFHPEFTHASTSRLAERDGVRPGPFTQQPDEFLAAPERFDPLRQVLFDLLDAVARVHAPEPTRT